MNDLKQYIWYIWSDARQMSRTSKCFLDNFELIQYSNPVPQYNLKSQIKVIDTQFSIMPAGWRSDYHPTPVPQWVITLSGSWATETQDGIKTIYRPGDVHFGADLTIPKLEINAQGHISYNVSDTQPCQLLVLQCDETLFPLGQVKNTLAIK